jgi:hypothetical protein
MKIDEPAFATEVAKRGVDGFVLRTMTDKKRAIIDRLATLRGTPASTLGTVVDAIAEAAVGPPRSAVKKGSTINKPFLHHGDLRIDGNVRIVAPFFVIGDLDVTGTIDHVGPDSFAAINGEVTAANLRTSGELCCSDIHAKGIVYGDYNDNTLCCGTINARIVISDDHDIQHAGVRADVYLDIDAYAQGHGKGVVKKLATHIHPEHFERDGDGRELLSHANVFAALFAGKRVFRPGKRPAPKRRLRY